MTRTLRRQNATLPDSPSPATASPDAPKAPPTACMDLASFSGLSSTIVAFTVYSAPLILPIRAADFASTRPLAPRSCSARMSSVAVVRSTILKRFVLIRAWRTRSSM